jgi:hypothetical protein
MSGVRTTSWVRGLYGVRSLGDALDHFSPSFIDGPSTGTDDAPVCESVDFNPSQRPEYLKLLGILREPSVASRNTTRASTLTSLVGTTDLSTFRRTAHNRTHLTEQAASVFVRLYQQQRQFFCTSRSPHNRTHLNSSTAGASVLQHRPKTYADVC